MLRLEHLVLLEQIPEPSNRVRQWTCNRIIKEHSLVRQGSEFCSQVGLDPSEGGLCTNLATGLLYASLGLCYNLLCNGIVNSEDSA
jgi:hypothetical protein